MKPTHAIAAIALAGLAAACSSERPLPTPRPIVIATGARLRPEPAQMAEVEAWLLPQLDSIQLDPGFLVEVVPVDDPTYPWHKVEVVGEDTVRVSLDRAARGALPPVEIYAHYHLMRSQGRLDKWFPEAEELTGYAQERAFLERTVDAWLYARSVWDASPYDPLEDLIYAKEAGLFDAIVLTLRAEEYPAEYEAWIAREPGGPERLRRWYRDTFDREFGGSG